jgi:flagellar motor switch protein FliM
MTWWMRYIFYIMKDVLSREEIDKLLTAINAAGTETDEISPVSRKIKIYDFKRPEKFSKEQIRAISIIHDTFSHLTTDSLCAQLRNISHVHVASVDELTYEEFIRTLPVPTTLAVFDMEPLKGGAVLEIDPCITFAIIDRICGGRGRSTKINHELTEIETSIMEDVIVRMAENLNEAWSTVFGLRSGLLQIDSNPQFVQPVPPADIVVLITLEANIGDVVGMINICIPYTTIEPIIGKLPLSWYKQTIPNNAISPYMDEVPVRLTAQVLKRDFSMKEILKWDTGTIILPLSPLKAGYCFLRLGDRCVWQCQILPDYKQFCKKITIVNYAEKPFETEGNYMETDTVNPLVADALSNAVMKITVELGATCKTVKEVYGIGEGTVVELDKLAGEPLDVKANGVIIAKGEVVIIDENFGVRITEIIGTKSGQSSPSFTEPATAGESK